MCDLLHNLVGQQGICRRTCNVLRMHFCLLGELLQEFPSTTSSLVVLIHKKSNAMVKTPDLNTRVQFLARAENINTLLLKHLQCSYRSQLFIFRSEQQLIIAVLSKVHQPTVRTSVKLPWYLNAICRSIHRMQMSFWERCLLCQDGVHHTFTLQTSVSELYFIVNGSK